MSTQYTVGQEVELCHVMTFVGRDPSVIRKSVVTRVTKAQVFVKGLTTNPDSAFWIKNGLAVGGSGDYMVRPVVVETKVPELQFTWLALAPLVQEYVRTEDVTLEPNIIRETVRGLIANGYTVPQDLFLEPGSVEHGLVHLLFDEGQAAIEITAQGLVTAV